MTVCDGRPLPPFWSYPHRFDCLIYLDELDERSGGLAIVPGSHLQHHTPLDPPTAAVTPPAGQRVLHGPPGTCVIMHRALWHRALPNLLGGRPRRMILVQWCPPEGRRSPRGRETKPVGDANLVTQLLKDAAAHGDTETLELLGKAGYQ